MRNNWVGGSILAAHTPPGGSGRLLGHAGKADRNVPHFLTDLDNLMPEVRFELLRSAAKSPMGRLGKQVFYMIMCDCS